LSVDSDDDGQFKSNQFPFVDWYDAGNITTDNNSFWIYTT